MVSEGCVYEGGEVCPVCFFVVGESSAFVASIGFLWYEGIGEDGEMIGWEFSKGRPGR